MIFTPFWKTEWICNDFSFIPKTGDFILFRTVKPSDMDAHYLNVSYHMETISYGNHIIWKPYHMETISYWNHIIWKSYHVWFIWKIIEDHIEWNDHRLDSNFTFSYFQNIIFLYARKGFLIFLVILGSSRIANTQKNRSTWFSVWNIVDLETVESKETRRRCGFVKKKRSIKILETTRVKSR